MEGLSYDALRDFLQGVRVTANRVWKLVAPLLNNTEEVVLIVNVVPTVISGKLTRLSSDNVRIIVSARKRDKQPSKNPDTVRFANLSAVLSAKSCPCPNPKPLMNSSRAGLSFTTTANAAHHLVLDHYPLLLSQRSPIIAHKAKNVI